MEILGGLMDYQVLQRNKKNVSETTLVGRCGSPGSLQIHVTKKGKTIPGFNWKTLAQVKAGQFTTKLVGIPVGGPYEVALRVLPKKGKSQDDVFEAKNVLVGDVWLLGGQSNMEGIGLLTGAAKPMPLVHAFYMHDRWDVAKDPIHNLDKAVDLVHTDLNGGKPIVRSGPVGVGPGVGFGQTMHKLSGVPQGLIACAPGGTSNSQWAPARKNLGTRSLYGATLRRFYKNGANVAGIVWYQGCSDTNPTDAPKYTDRMKKLVAAFRKDLRNPNLPFIMVQIATYFPTQPFTPEGKRAWNSVQDQERLLPKVIKNLTTVPAMDLELDDCIHISGPDQNRLGRRLAEAAWALIHGPKGGKLPIELKSIKRISPDAFNFEVTFDNVVGALRSPGKPAGFSVVNTEGIEMPTIYRVDLEGNKVIIKTGLTTDTDDSAFFLTYGFGGDAYCNITDEADRSLPVFAPQPLYQNQNPRTSIRTVRVSKILPGAGKLEKVKCPDTSDRSLAFKSRTFPTAFYNLHEELQNKKDDALVFFAAKFECAEPMKLELGLGYDGPTKVWINGKQVHYDPDGINPMIFDQIKVPYNAKKGMHEIVIAFSANFGLAWGPSIRLYRKDLTSRQIKAGPNTYKLPEALG